MLVSAWVFIGVEGTIGITLSAWAKKHSDVGKTTVIGLLCTLILYVAISLLSLGVMPPDELATLLTPSMGMVLERVVGSGGYSLLILPCWFQSLGLSLAGLFYWRKSHIWRQRKRFFPNALGLKTKGAAAKVHCSSQALLFRFF